MFPGRRRSAPLPLHCENIFIPFPWPFPTYNKFEQGDHERTWAKVSLISLNDNIMNLIRDNTVGKGVDCLRLNAVLNNCLVVSRLPVHLLICFVAFLHQYFIQHTFQATNDLFTMTFVKRRKECAGVRTHNPSTNSPRCYRLSYLGSSSWKEKFIVMNISPFDSMFSIIDCLKFSIVESLITLYSYGHSIHISFLVPKDKTITCMQFSCWSISNTVSWMI